MPNASGRQPNLYSWQAEAVAAWRAAGGRGIVEAVTGSGKTRVGVEALAQLRSDVNRLHTLIVVPTIDLMQQWYERLRDAFPGDKVGRIGGGHKDDFSTVPVACVAVVNSVAPKMANVLGQCKHSSNKSFLIADECHRYIDAPLFGRIREFPFDFTLGMSATVEPYEVAGLGRVVYQHRFVDAHRHGIVPAFDLVNVAVPFTQSERRDYLDCGERVKAQLQKVYNLYGEQLRGLQDRLFFRRLRHLMALPNGQEDPSVKRLFLLLFKRSGIVYAAEKKMSLAQRVVRLLVEQGNKKVVVFFERISSAEDASDGLIHQTATSLHGALTSDDPIWCRVYHSQMRRQHRDDILKGFRKVGASALLACRGLDEGIDIPEIDAAVLVSSTQSLRQRIQRIGRTLRKGPGGKRPLVATLFVPGTGDQNPSDEDTTTFSGVATIYRENEASCIGRVQGLIRGARP